MFSNDLRCISLHRMLGIFRPYYTALLVQSNGFVILRASLIAVPKLQYFRSPITWVANLLLGNVLVF